MIVKRILFVIPTMRMGGAEKALVSLLKCLDPEKTAVDVFLFEHGGVLQKQIPSWVTVLPEDDTTRFMALELRSNWKKLLAKCGIGAVFSRVWMSVRSSIRAKLKLNPASGWELVKKHIPTLPGEYDAAIGFLEGTADFFALEKVTAGKKIAWIHSDLGKQQIAEKDKERYDCFDSFATITEACRESFARAVGVAVDRVSVIGNIVSAEQILQSADEIQPEWSKEFPNILTVGRLEYQKGSDIGLEACNLLAEKQMKFCWHFIGTGSLYEKLQKKVMEYGISERCIFEGQKENPYPYMKRADLIVQPSRVEGKSIVLDEAKILGKAILAADYPSVTDQIEDGVTGMIARMSPEAIADSIEQLLNDAELRHKLEKNCRESVLDTSSKETAKFYALIEA